MPLILCLTVVALRWHWRIVGLSRSLRHPCRLAAGLRRCSSGPRKRVRAWFSCLRRTTPAATKNRRGLEITESPEDPTSKVTYFDRVAGMVVLDLKAKKVVNRF